MSVENYIDLYADRPSELIERMQKLYPSSPNETNEERCFLNDHVNVSVSSWDKRTIEWMREDYGVNVNCCLSFQYFSDSDCNSADELLYVIKHLVRMLNCDLLYQPNGDSPVMVRRSGILLFDDYFDRYFGKGASDSLREQNRISITADLSMEDIMKRCEEKFGDDFNWWMLPEEKREAAFVSELKLELGEDDPFFDGRVYAIYKCDANDDMLFQSVRKDGTELWRIYHLTYSHCREKEGFPRRWDFESGQKAAEYIINQYVEENESCGLKL
ncbi:MAG: hypothetical protein IKH75_08475 [Ruminococcus sp.]|nr:hypothetical protein [Ruminococcus sp.]